MMPSIRRRTVLSFIGFTAVLCLAIIFRPQKIAVDLVEYDYSEHAVGIELGRTYSRIGIIKNKTFEIIVDDQGRSAVPSYVQFTDEGPPLVGFEAMHQADSNPKNTIYDVRCLIGRHISDPKLQGYIRDLPYDVREKRGKPCIEVKIKGVDTCLYPQEISSLVVAKLKNMAEAYLGTSLKYAVITVPSHFNDEQRQMTKDAITLAGLETLRIVKEPIAIGIAYGIEVDPEHEERYFVIYDLGAKESTVTLELTDNGVFEILSQANDESLGGDTFDSPLLNYALSHFKKNNRDPAKDFSLMLSLKSQVEEAQRALLTELSFEAEVQDHETSAEFSMTFRRTQLQELNEQLCDRALTLVKKVIKDAKIDKKDVNAIIFSGNPLQLTKIRPSIQAYLDGEKTLFLENINPDQAVIRGAALQGSLFSPTTDDDYDDIGCPMFDVTDLGLGIETNEGNFKKIILRNSIYPIRKRSLFSTIRDNQEKAEIKIMEGERKVASKNRLLGTLELTGLGPKPKGVPDIQVEFEFDPNKVLKVVMREKGSGKESSIQILIDVVHHEEIDNIVLDAETHDQEDELLLQEYLVNAAGREEENMFGLVAKVDDEGI